MLVERIGWTSANRINELKQQRRNNYKLEISNWRSNRLCDRIRLDLSRIKNMRILQLKKIPVSPYILL